MLLSGVSFGYVLSAVGRASGRFTDLKTETIKLQNNALQGPASSMLPTSQGKRRGYMMLEQSIMSLLVMRSQVRHSAIAFGIPAFYRIYRLAWPR
jgi:hypothetical protein